MTPATTETATETPSAPSADKVVVKRNVFDLNSFERKSIEKEITLKTVKTVDEMNEAAGSDESEILRIFNIGLRRAQILDAKNSMGDDNLVSPKVVSGFVNNFKPLYPARDDSKEARKEQLTKIYAFVRSNPALLEAIKSIAAAVAVSDEDEDGDGGSEE